MFTAVLSRPDVTGEALPLPLPLPLPEVVVHAAGTRVVVDGAFLVPHRRFSLAATGADWVALSGHEFCALRRRCGRRPPRGLDAGPAHLAGGERSPRSPTSTGCWPAGPESSATGRRWPTRASTAGAP